MSTANSQNNCLDPLDSLIDFSEYEQVSYQSPSISPSTQKQQFTTRPVSNTPPTLPSNQPTLSGPSHDYDLYRQQTGIPQGAIANTLAVNMSNNHINQYGFNDTFLSGLSPNDDFVDFGSAPANGFKTDTDMEFDSPNPEPAFFYPEQSASEFIDPSSIGSHHGLPVPATQSTSNVGRLWPGMHQQQAALAKAQAQQKQQQQIIQQQRQASAKPAQRPRGSHPPTDPIVEEKISQLLNSMRHSSVSTEDNDAKTPGNVSHARSRKDEEEMDEDERLLASEEGKKLSSKERRQLRNKVSARAFRSRRKEYIGQLEGEIAVKVNENSDLRSQNRALMEENTRLSDLTRMLLSSPSFSGFLDTLSSNPAAAQTAQAVTQSQPQQVEQPRQVRKDVNPYAAQQQMQQQHVGMTMIPEHTMDFSMLDLGNDGSFSYQPQVFSVLDIPETVIDAEVLSGKTSFSPLPSDDEKVELPTVERMPATNPEKEIQAPTTPLVDEEFDSDPSFALFTAPVSTEPATKVEELDITALIMNINPKPSQYDLVISSTTDDAASDVAMRRVERMFESLESVTERLTAFTLDL